MGYKSLAKNGMAASQLSAFILEQMVIIRDRAAIVHMRVPDCGRYYGLLRSYRNSATLEGASKSR